MISFGVYYSLWNVAPANSDEKNFLFSHSVIWRSLKRLLKSSQLTMDPFILRWRLCSLQYWPAP